MKKLLLAIAVLLVALPGTALADGPLGLFVVEDAADADKTLPLDIKTAKFEAFGTDDYTGWSSMSIESYEDFEIGHFTTGPRGVRNDYWLQFLVNYTSEHKGADMWFNVRSSGDFGPRFEVIDYKGGSLYHGNAPRPTDDSVIIFFPNELVPTETYKWGARVLRGSPDDIRAVDRAPDSGLIRVGSLDQ
jgi:hypothetical protein